MINTEIIIPTFQNNARVFIALTDIEQVFEPCPPHRHKMTEVQIVTSGKARFDAGGKKTDTVTSEMIVIPQNTFHQRLESTQSTKVIAFQTSINVKSFQKFTLKSSLISELKDELFLLASDGCVTKLPYLFGIILSEFTNLSKDSIISVQDRAFLIDEYLNQNYSKNITLADVAKVLNLSEKQAERTIKQYTGKSFKKLLADYRINAAKVLIQQGELSLTQIAQKVGYNSYSGFWKAYTKNDL